MKYFITYLGNYYLTKDYYKNAKCWTTNVKKAGKFTSFEIQLIKRQFFGDLELEIKTTPLVDQLKKDKLTEILEGKLYA